MKTPFLITMLIVCLMACTKEANRRQLDAYFNYEVNGTNINISKGIILNENLFECRMTGDTALQLLASKAYDGAGIYLRDPNGIKDGTYQLDNQNRAYYINPVDQKKYSTTIKFSGSIRIRKGTFQAKTMLNIYEGTFKFNAVDTLTGKKFTISNGAFLMEQSQ